MSIRVGTKRTKSSAPECSGALCKGLLFRKPFAYLLVTSIVRVASS